MFNNCYRPGAHFDMNRCNCPKCKDKDCNDEKDWDKDEENNQCCFPIDIYLTVKQGKNQNEFGHNDCDKFDRMDEQRFENENDYNQENYYNNYYPNGYGDNFNQKENHEEYTFNKKECCFPIDVCFSMKEGCRKRKDNEKNDNYCNNRKNDRCHWNRPCQNHNRPCQNNGCCLGFLAGCLFGCRRNNH